MIFEVHFETTGGGGECPAKTRKILQNVAAKKYFRLASTML